MASTAMVPCAAASLLLRISLVLATSVLFALTPTFALLAKPYLPTLTTVPIL